MMGCGVHFRKLPSKWKVIVAMPCTFARDSIMQTTTLESSTQKFAGLVAETALLLIKSIFQ